MKIYPTGGARLISGASTTANPRALVRLNGADRVTIDGSVDAAGTDRNLTIVNTDTSTSSAVVWIQSNGTDGATSNTIKNLNVTGNGNTQTLFGIGSGNNTISTSSSGAGNNAKTFQNNNVSKTQYGIFSQGTSAGSKNAGNVITQNRINTSSPNNVRRAGILVGFEDNIQITQNIVSEIASNSNSEDVFGISLGTTSIGTTSVAGNEVTNAVVARNVIGTVRQTATYSACGIFVAPAASGTNQLVNNSLAGVSSNGTSSDFTSGILLGGGAGSTTQVYFNSVSMNGTQTGGNDRSYALAVFGSNPVVDVRNNVFYNTLSTGTGNNYAVVFGYSTFTNLTSNYNDFFVSSGATYFVGATGSLSSPTNQASLANLQTATGKDANSLSLNPLFYNPTNSTYNDNETNADHTFLVTVTRTGGSGGAVSVDYAVTDGTATIADNDYSVTQATGTLNWADGITTPQTITITINGDTTPESNETINLTLNTPTGGATIGANNPATLTIINDDGPTASASRITGRIVAPGGQPISGTTITVTGGSTVIRAITDADGFYNVENLATGGFYSVTPSRANYGFAPASRSFSLLGERTNASFTAVAMGPVENPLDTPEFFVRQQYVDFLGREPDQGGLDYWSGQLRACGTDPFCLNDRRIGVSAAFFVEQEFQLSGLFIYDVYRAALGRRPAYAEYSVDKQLLSTGSTLESDKAAFAITVVESSEFIQRYPLTMSADVFVDAVLQTAQQVSTIDLSGERGRLIGLYHSGTDLSESRSLVLRHLAESDPFKEAQYNSAFVLMEYFGYLGREPDQGGYDFWLNVLTHHAANNYRGMVCAFLTSREYQQRFGGIITRTNRDCGQ